MRHMVVYRSMDGGPTYHETDDLEGAVRAVEHLRNSQNVTDARIFSLQEVPIEVKTYYRVEVVAAEVPRAPAPLPETRVETPPASALDGVPTHDVDATEEAEFPPAAEAGFMPAAPVLPAGSGRFGLFSRG